MRIAYAERARSELREIAKYSRKKWGTEQALHYILQIRTACDELAHFPLLGKIVESDPTGFRRLVLGSHVVFYRLGKEQVEIVRILHRDMLPENHLNKD